MKLTDNARRTAQHLLDAFASGAIPEALATVFINRRRVDIPSHRWSWSNQLIAFFSGTLDARGFRQWNDAGRHVKAGSSAIYILVPMVYPAREDEKPDSLDEKGRPMKTVGFKACPVFRVEDTEGEPIDDGLDQDTRAWLANLPMRNVAEAWGLAVAATSGDHGRAHGAFYFAGDKGVAITIAAQSVQTFLHELTHAAECRLGRLGSKQGQDPAEEIVAELGSLTLCHLLGIAATEADPGGTWRYISAYAERAKRAPLAIANELVTRTAEAVAHILEAAENLAESQQAAA